MFPLYDNEISILVQDDERATCKRVQQKVRLAAQKQKSLRYSAGDLSCSF